MTDPGSVVAAAALLDQELDVVEAIASRFRDDSALTLLNQAAGSGPVAVPPLLVEAVDIALKAAEQTGGTVDPTVGRALCQLGYDRDFAEIADGVAMARPTPSPVPGWRSVIVDAHAGTISLPVDCVLDLGATAKAWAADRSAASIGRRLGCGVLVSLGGDLAVVNAPSGGFPVGLADVCATPAEATVAVAAGGLATSGIGHRRWSLADGPAHHLVDPATGLPAESCWQTVSVTGPSCVAANTASTAAMILGAAAPAWLTARNLPARLVHRDGSVTTINGWPEDSAAVVREGAS